MSTNNVVGFKRVKDLRVKERFLYQGVWFQVTKRDEESIWYGNITSSPSINGRHRFGAKSQQFVQTQESI